MLELYLQNVIHSMIRCQCGLTMVRSLQLKSIFRKAWPGAWNQDQRTKYSWFRGKEWITRRLKAQLVHCHQKYVCFPFVGSLVHEDPEIIVAGKWNISRFVEKFGKSVDYNSSHSAIQYVFSPNSRVTHYKKALRIFEAKQGRVEWYKPLTLKEVTIFCIIVRFLLDYRKCGSQQENDYGDFFDFF